MSGEPDGTFVYRRSEGLPFSAWLADRWIDGWVVVDRPNAEWALLAGADEIAVEMRLVDAARNAGGDDARVAGQG